MAGPTGGAGSIAVSTGYSRRVQRFVGRHIGMMAAALLHAQQDRRLEHNQLP
ncbi:MAG: hypothetical protein JNN16_05695 [Nitrospira sp.]|nr:hypothetical protein [Nitrospira sp.]MBS0168256.1 hypothetical protein [Nitrospira sp.]